MFPDSAIANQFQGGRTQAKAVICNIMVPVLKSDIVNAMKSDPVSSLADETMDVTNVEKFCIIIILIIIKAHFYKMPILTSATAKSIINSITSAFISLGTAGAGTMISVIPGLYKRLKGVQPNLCSMRCICHQLHFVEKKAADTFSGDVHDLPVKI